MEGRKEGTGKKENLTVRPEFGQAGQPGMFLYFILLKGGEGF